MSRKRYRETINPQIAVQDYLNDLLQQMPTTSVLDELKKADDEKEVLATEKLAKITAEKRPKIQKKTEKTIGRRSIGLESEVPDKSLAYQRLEKKRALARVPQKEFREPLILKTAPILKTVFKTAPPPLEKPSLPELNAVTENRHEKTLSAEKTAVQPESEIEPEIEPEPELETEPEPIKQWLTSGKPEWAQGRFECLIFTVAGLKLAVPLVSLGAIHTIDKELTPLVGRPSWFLGLLTVGDRNVRVVDSAQWIMPERHTESVKDNYKFVIRLNDSEWGMACDSVAQSFSLAPEEVRWRTDRGKRPWLAGTVIEHMCALMDVAAVSWLLDDAGKNHLSPI